MQRDATRVIRCALANRIGDRLPAIALVPCAECGRMTKITTPGLVSRFARGGFEIVCDECWPVPSQRKLPCGECASCEQGHPERCAR